jgi:hypothetical protein
MSSYIDIEAVWGLAVAEEVMAVRKDRRRCGAQLSTSQLCFSLCVLSR